MDEAKNMLRQCRSLRLEITSYEERIERLRSQMESAANRLSLSSGKGTPEHDKLGEQMAQLLELEEALTSTTIVYECTCIDIEAMIKQLPEQERKIIWYRYIDGLNWKKIAFLMNYSVENCFVLHRAARRNFTVNYSKICDIV